MVKRGLAWKAKAWAPTGRYSASLPSKYPDRLLNSLEVFGVPLCSGPVLAQLFDHSDPLVRRELGPELPIRPALLLE